MSTHCMASGDFPQHLNNGYWYGSQAGAGAAMGGAYGGGLGGISGGAMGGQSPWNQQPNAPWYQPQPVPMPGINAPLPTITITLPSPELEELRKRVAELEAKLFKLCPPEEKLEGEGPALDKTRVVEL